MTTYYVDVTNGSDSNAGTSYGAAKASLNGAEDIPVVAGDTVYVAPGTYEETLTVDVAGSSGSVITYIADRTGANTDGVGGDVRITGSDNDQTVTRSYCIYADGKDYRTFRGFTMDLAYWGIYTTGSCTNWTVEDCFLQCIGGSSNAAHEEAGIYVNGTSQSDWTVRRCSFFNFADDPSGNLNECFGIGFIVTDSSINDSNHLVENCLFYESAQAVKIGDYTNGGACGGVVVKNCTFVSGDYGVYYWDKDGDDTVVAPVIRNCIFDHQWTMAISGWPLNFVDEDYNAFWKTGPEPVQEDHLEYVTQGSNSVVYPAFFEQPLLYNGGLLFPWRPFNLASYSPLRQKTGSSMSADDLYGITRPTTDSKKSWGAIQWEPIERETTTTYNSSTASIKLADAARHQTWVPVQAEQTKIAVRVQREADYAGTDPQLTIIEPDGTATTTTNEGGAAGTWYEMSVTITPSGNYVIAELVSNNTATSGSYAVYFDSLVIS